MAVIGLISGNTAAVRSDAKFKSDQSVMQAYVQRRLSVRASHIKHAHVLLRIAMVIDTPKS